MKTEISIRQKTSFSALLEKIKSMNIQLRDNAISPKYNEFTKREEVELLKFLNYSYESFDYYYLDSISNNKKWDTFLTEAISKNNCSEFRTHGSFEDAYHWALIHSESEFGDIDHIERIDSNVNLYSRKQKVTVITKVINDDFTSFNSALSKRFEKAIKGLSNASSNQQVTKKLSQFKGLSTISISTCINRDKNAAITKHTVNELFMPKVSNYVFHFKNIINILAITPITLSQAKELFCAYFCIDSWHSLIKNEKESRYSSCVIDIVNNKDNKVIDIKHTKNFEDALIVMDNLIKEYPDNYETCSSISKGFYLSATNYSIGLITDCVGLDNCQFDDSNYFNQASELLPALKNIRDSFYNNEINNISFHKSEGNIDKLPHDMPMIYEKEIEGHFFYLTISMHYGLSITKKDLGIGYYMSEIGNAFIQKNSKDELHIFRGFTEERINLTGLSLDGVRELANSFGLRMEPDRFNKVEGFIASPAGKSFSDWAEKNLSTFDFHYGTKNFELDLEHLNKRVKAYNQNFEKPVN